MKNCNNNKVIVLKIKLLKAILLSGATETLRARQLLSVLATPVSLNGPETFLKIRFHPAKRMAILGLQDGTELDFKCYLL